MAAVEAQDPLRSSLDALALLSSRGLALEELLTGVARLAVRAIPGVETVEPELVWSPAWTPDRMSDDAKFILGIG